MGEGVFLHWYATHSGKIAHAHFQMLSKPPRAHWTITRFSNPHYSSEKKKGIILKETNQLLPLLPQPTNLYLSNKRESSSLVQKTSGAAHLISGRCDSRVDRHNLASLEPC